MPTRKSARAESAVDTAPGRVLADSGFLIGLFSERDAHHAICLAFSARFRGIYVTTWSVFTEVCLMLEGPSLAHFFAWAHQAQGLGLLVIQNPEPAEIDALWNWMQRYVDLPMDFCDASIVVVAQALALYRIATTDRRDFTAYRLPNRKRFVHVLYE